MLPTPAAVATPAATLAPAGPPMLDTAYLTPALVYIYDAPESATFISLANPVSLGDVLVLPVLDSTSTPGWLQVMVPVRPNERTGWIKASDAVVQPNTHRVVVSVSARQVTHWDGDSVVGTYPCAVGADRSPTPVATGFVANRIDMVKAGYGLNAGYGPFLLGTSIHSEALATFNGQDALIAIHGHGQTATVGHNVSNGCCRMYDADITTMWPLVPLGAPVHLVA